MAFKLIEAAQAQWRGVNGSHLVTLGRAVSEPKVGRFASTTRCIGRGTTSSGPGCPDGSSGDATFEKGVTIERPTQDQAAAA